MRWRFRLPSNDFSPAIVLLNYGGVNPSVFQTRLCIPMGDVHGRSVRQ